MNDWKHHMDPPGLLKIKKLGRHRIKPNICFACFAVNIDLAGIPASEVGASSVIYQGDCYVRDGLKLLMNGALKHLEANKSLDDQLKIDSETAECIGSSFSRRAKVSWFQGLGWSFAFRLYQARIQHRSGGASVAEDVL